MPSSIAASSILSSPRSKRRNVSYRESSPWLIATTVISVSSRHAGRHATGTARRPGCDISNLRGVTSLSCAYMICSCHLEKSQSAPFRNVRSEEHTSELQSLMRISYAVFCLKKKNKNKKNNEVDNISNKKK